MHCGTAAVCERRMSDSWALAGGGGRGCRPHHGLEGEKCGMKEK